MDARTPIIVQDRKDCIWGCQLKDGRIIVTCNPDYFLRWDEIIYLDGEYTSLNALVASGKASNKLVTCYDEYSIVVNDASTRGIVYIDVEKIQREFAEHGFKVSKDAIEHNYNAWSCGFKSGYRGRGYHLVTPCGGNPLIFSATTLDKRCKDWQHTYMC